MNLTVNSTIRRKDASEGGLIGGFFRFKENDEIFGISCNHVIANLNSCQIGDILTDSENKQIGTLSHWLILEPDIVNSAEFALFRPTAGSEIYWQKENILFTPDGFLQQHLNMNVEFPTLITTTYGRITDTARVVKIKWQNQEFQFTCVQVESNNRKPFSTPGQSGGVVFSNNSLIGIILGVSQDGKKTYLIPFINGILQCIDFFPAAD